MVDAETLACAVNRTERHACSLGAVPGIHGLQAGITVTAGFRQGVTEVTQQGLPATGGDLT